jgi:hypothetical protein
MELVVGHCRCPFLPHRLADGGWANTVLAENTVLAKTLCLRKQKDPSRNARGLSVGLC